MQAYVINLPADIERRSEIERQLSSSPLDSYKFVEGVNAVALGEAACRRLFDYEQFSKIHVGQPTLGEIGCTLAHAECWRRIVDSGQPGIVIEDDIFFEGSWANVLDVISMWLMNPEPRAIILSRHLMYFRSHKVLGLDMAINPHNACGTYFYAINPAGASLLLSIRPLPHYIADDWDYYRSCGLKLSALLTHPVYHPADNKSNVGVHGYENYAWDFAARSVLPQIPLCEYAPTFWRLFLLKTGIMKVSLEPRPQ